MAKFFLFFMMQFVFSLQIFAGPNCKSTIELQTQANRPKIKRFLLVTGCGRSGTTYMTEFLRLSGLRVKHEEMDLDGSVSWIMGAETDWTPVGPLLKNYEFEHIFHQVRHPLKVIQSYYNSKPGVTWEWICTIIPEISMQDSILTRCAKYWYYWNLMIEEKAEWTYRIEDFAEKYQEMGDRLGLVFDAKVLQLVPTDTNTRVQKVNTVITWKFLKENLDRETYLQVRALAKKYGYVNKQ